MASNIFTMTLNLYINDEQMSSVAAERVLWFGIVDAPCCGTGDDVLIHNRDEPGGAPLQALCTTTVPFVSLDAGIAYFMSRHINIYITTAKHDKPTTFIKVAIRVGK